MKDLSQTRMKLQRHGVREIMVRSAKFPDVIHLEVGEPNFETPLHIKEAAITAIRDGYTHYTHNLGYVSLRKTLSNFLNNKYNLKLDEGQIIVASGAVTALAISLLAIVDAGEEVLVPDPAWPVYEQMVQSQGAISKRYHLRPENNFLPQIKELEELVTGKTKAIMLNTPSNPTGAVFDKNTIKEILNFAVKYDLYVLSDEIYDGIIFEGKHYSPLSFDRDGRVISIYGVSKNYAMTGWRIGFAVAPTRIVEVMEKITEPLIACASSVSQKATEAAYNGSSDCVLEMCQIYKKRRDIAWQIFHDHNIKVYKPQGTFYMLVDLSETGLTPENIALNLLEEEHVAVAPGNTFGKVCHQMIRVSLATEESALVEGAKRICKFVERFRN